MELRLGKAVLKGNVDEMVEFLNKCDYGDMISDCINQESINEDSECEDFIDAEMFRKTLINLVSHGDNY